MAIRTGKPRGGGLAKFAPSSTYEGVASKYAAAFISALSQKKRLELDTNLLAYANGDLTFDDLKNFLDQQVTAEGDTQYGLLLKQTLAQYSGIEHSRKRESRRAELEAKAIQDGAITAGDRLEIEREMLKFESAGSEEFTAQQQEVITAFENFETDKVNRAFTALAEELGGDRDGLTLKDQLEINVQLQGIANKQSDVFAKLVEDEGVLRNRIFEVGKGAGAGSALSTLDASFAETEVSDLEIANALARGFTIPDENGDVRVVTVVDALPALLENALERQAALQAAIDAGANVSETDITKASTVGLDMFSRPDISVNELAALVQAAENGQAVELFDRNGQLRILSVDEMLLDSTSASPQFVKPIFEPIEVSPGSGIYAVVDTRTNEIVVGANNQPLTGLTKTSAQNQASSLGGGFIVDVATEGQRDPWIVSPDGGTFSRLANPDVTFPVISASEDQIIRLQMQNPQAFGLPGEAQEVAAPGTGGPLLEPRTFENRPGVRGFIEDVKERVNIRPIEQAFPPLGVAKTTLATGAEALERFQEKAQQIGPFIKPTFDIAKQAISGLAPVQDFTSRLEGIKRTFSGIGDIGKSFFQPVRSPEFRETRQRGVSDVTGGFKQIFGPSVSTQPETQEDRPGFFSRIASGIKSFFNRE